MSIIDGHELFRLRFRTTETEEHQLRVKIDMDGFAKPMVMGSALEKLNFIPTIEDGLSIALALFPNPFTNRDQVSIHLQAQPGENVEVEILSATGSLVKTIDIIAESEIVKLKWDGRDNLGSEIPSGLYIVNINCIVGITRHKLVKH